MESFGRMQEHLGANDIVLGKSPAVVGPWLEFDPDSERFNGAQSDAANAMVSREYRPPFVVPEKV